MGSIINKTESSIVPTPEYLSICNDYQDALKLVDDVVLKNYITELSNMDIVPLDDSVVQTNLRDNVRFFKITEMAYEKDELATHKFASVFNTLSISDGTVFIIIDSDGLKTDFYMGVRSFDEYRTVSSMKNTVENAMKGQFPGLKIYDDYTIADMEQILAGMKSRSISAVSCVANRKGEEHDTNQNFVQGLEKLVLSMQGEKYTGIIIANNAGQTQLKDLRKGYESIYTQLSAFATKQVNYSNNNTFNYSLAETKGSASAKNYNKNWSNSETHTIQKGTSEQHGTSRENFAGKAVKGVSAAASLLGVALAPVTGGVSLGAGYVISAGLNSLGAAVSSNISDSTSINESVSDGFTTLQGGSEGTTETLNYGISKTEGYAKGISEGLTITMHDKSIENMLERIDTQLRRIDEFESLGMYECAAYFMSDQQCAAEIAAATYKSLMRGEHSGVEIAAVNTWGPEKKDTTEEIEKYIKNFIHPVFQYPSITGNIEVTPCSLVSGNELSIHMGLPRKSVCGLPVIEHANFAREVFTYDSDALALGVKLGNIFNMGSVSERKVHLSIDSLVMHTFITGSTGSGKSNTVYEIIRQLDYNDINFLIVEPAKGEYKHVFGNLHGVQVYGTNPQHTELLRINPFKFPNGIHILEHIDRLIEIFNVCWPMYAAMPAVLKNAVEKSYADCGWDLVQSKNRYSNDLYPSFVDVARNIKDIIDSSEYDNENKGAYKGSLLTRLQSLTNGIYGMIFTSDDLDDKQLFDEKVIVDLSRVGSSETKSLIMGMLVLKLQEHRMSTANGMNEELKHVTVLEEAHNLLKRTSTEQSAEGANLVGKSVEMLTNAIAEMRTYGEGFIIADQAPGLLDQAVIRNTNTKIIMRLPDFGDRELVCKSANLNDEQIEEVAKLPRGVAAVYQNDWVQPVLCKVKKYEGTHVNVPYKMPEKFSYFDEEKSRRLQESILENIMTKGIFQPGNREDIQKLKDMVIKSKLDTKVKCEFIDYITSDKENSLVSLRRLLYDFLEAGKAIDAAAQIDNISEWVKSVVDNLAPSIKEYSKQQINLVIALVLLEQTTKDTSYQNLFTRFTEIYQEGGVF